MDEHRWETFLQRLARRGEPADFKEFMTEHTARTPSVDLEMWASVYPLIIVDDVARTMLAVTLQLPASEAERTLEQIAGVLPRANFKRRLAKTLSRELRRLHQQAVRVIRHTVIPGTSALIATFRAYIRGDYDLEEDPNVLVREANRLVAQDPDRALELVGRAGALALRGKELWDRWSEDATPPMNHWMLVLNTFVDHLQHKPNIFPMDAIENERSRWPEVLQALEAGPELESTEEPEREAPGLAYVNRLLDDLDPFLYGEQPITAKTLASLPNPPEEYIDVLIHSVQSWDDWDFSEPETQEFIANMVAVLGELQAEEVVEPCIDIVARATDMKLYELVEAAINALATIGKPALKPILDFVQYSDNNVARVDLAGILPQIGRDDPRTYKVLAQLFEEVRWVENELGAGKAEVAETLGELGDERPIPLLLAALNDPAASEEDREVIAKVLEELGAQSG